MRSSSGLLWMLAGALALFAFSRTKQGRAVVSELTGALAQRAEMFRTLFDDATRRYGLPAGLLMAQANKESQFDPAARGADGEIGIMQIIPRWHPEIDPGDAGADARAAADPAKAIPYAAKLLRTYRDRYGSWSLALAAYNAGPRAVEKYGRAVPPFAVTRDYVAKILKGAGIVEPGVRYA